MFKPQVTAQSDLAIQSTAAGSGWVAHMLESFNQVQSHGGGQGGYLMDGGAIIANPDGCVSSLSHKIS